jgi:hypothetical protein
MPIGKSALGAFLIAVSPIRPLIETHYALPHLTPSIELRGNTRAPGGIFYLRIPVVVDLLQIYAETPGGRRNTRTDRSKRTNRYVRTLSLMCLG